MPDHKSNIETLDPRERELTAIGAAIASNCVPCIEYHIPKARKVGLSDAQILEAVELADQVRRVPADKVLQTAMALLEPKASPEGDVVSAPCGCSGAGTDAEGGGSGSASPDRVGLDTGSATDDNVEGNSGGGKRAGECCS